jgi:hypothetical protein
LLGSIFGLTALVTMIIRHTFKGSIKIVVASILGILAGIAGASHGPGEILQGNIAPDGIIIEAWPSLTLLIGEPAMTVIPNLLVTGVLAIISGLTITIWTAATQLQRKNGGLILIMLSIGMLLVGGGLIPPAIGVIAGIIGTQIRQSDDKDKRSSGAEKQVNRGDMS